MGSFWQRWTRRNGEEVSPWIGLAFAGLYLGAIVAVGAASFILHQSETSALRLADAKQWTRWLARHLAQVNAGGPEIVVREILLASRESGVDSCALVASDG